MSPGPAEQPPAGAARRSAPAERVVQLRAFQLGLLGTLGVGVGLAIIGSLQTVSTLLAYVGLALFLALGLDPVVSWLERKGLRRGWAVATVFLGLVGVAVGISFLIVPVLLRQIQDFVQGIPQLFEEFRRTGVFQELDERFAGVTDVDALADNLNSYLADPENLLSLGGGVLAIGAGIVGFAGGLLIVLILTLYFVTSLASIKRGLYLLVPASSQVEFMSVAEEVTRSVGRYVLGQTSLAATNGILSFAVLSLLGAPLPVLLAAIAFLGSMVPLVGTLTGSTIIVISCLVADPHVAFIAAVYYLIYMQVEAYLLSPRIMNKAVQVPGSLVVIAAVAGGTLGGVLGALVAIPLAASLLIVVRRVVVPRQAQR